MLNHPGLNQFQRNQKSVQDKNGSKKNTKNQGSNGKNRGNKSAKRGNKNSKKQRKSRKNNRKPAKIFIPPEPSVPDLSLNIKQRGKKSQKSSQHERKSKQEIIPNGIPTSEYLPPPPPPPQIELGLVPFINGFFETTTIVSNIVLLSFPSIITYLFTFNHFLFVYFSASNNNNNYGFHNDNNST